MRKTIWDDAIEAGADPRRARQFVDQLIGVAGSKVKQMSAEQARILTALFSGSQALSEQVIAHPDWVSEILTPENLQSPGDEHELRGQVQAWLKPAIASRDYASAFAKLRTFKQREMLRVAARDLARIGPLTEIIGEISAIADICLDAVLQLCQPQLLDRLGQPWHQDTAGKWQPTRFCVLGMGKLGGAELNYSSDVDVLFAYDEEGWVFKTPPKKSEPGGKGMASHQFFKRLAEMFIAEVSRLAPEGVLYRIDLRLRPEGDSGPLARSLESYENYYAQWGQIWERMMLIKTRRVAGDPGLAAEFLEMIQPFRYTRALSINTLGEVAAMKQRIETEVVRPGEIDRNVKLGRGGIREIEFVAQTLQLLNAGRYPFLQGTQTLPTLQNLVRYDLLTREDAGDLSDAYVFLREVEHRLQMENNLQTHTIPTERKARERLARLMGLETLDEFEAVRLKHTQNVRRIYDSLVRNPVTALKSTLPAGFEGTEEKWSQLLKEHSFRDPAKAFRLVREFVHGPGYVHVSQRTAGLASELLPRFLELCPRQLAPGGTAPKRRAGPQPVGTPDTPAIKQPDPSSAKKILSDPDRVLARLDSFISAYGSRAPLYETWTHNPSLFLLLLELFDRSEFLAEVAIRTPDLVDELEASDRLRRRKTAEEILADLRHGSADPDQSLWVRRYHQAELMRIGLRDILGLADSEQYLVELSNLAEACLQYAIEVVLKRNKFQTAPFAIIGLGKLGGREINYGSDLDVIFVADSKTRNLPRLQALAVEIMELISTKTEHGMAFVTDARLRPDGEKGLLVNTIDAYSEYYRQRAMLWEIQALTRARPIAGNPETAGQFQALAASLTDFRQAPKISAYSPDWRQEIARMRQRIEKERTPAGKEALAIKTGAGGLIDAEFIAQVLCLGQGWHEPNTLSALERAAKEKIIPEPDVTELIANYRKLRRVEGILRRWSYEGETVLPEEPAPQYRVAVRCGYSTGAEFLEAVAGFRTAIRRVYANLTIV